MNMDRGLSPVELANRILSERISSTLMTILSDVVFPDRAMVQFSDLINLLTRVGISESAAKSTIFRAKSEGELISSKIRNCSFYEIGGIMGGAAGESYYRIFRQPFHEHSSELWEIVVIISESLKKNLRDKICMTLQFDGCGKLNDSVFIRPLFDAAPCLSLKDLFPEDFESYFLTSTGKLGDFGLFQHNSLNARSYIDRNYGFETLLSEYANWYEQFVSAFKIVDENELTGEESLAVRFGLVTSFRAIVKRTAAMPLVWSGDVPIAGYYDYFKQMYYKLRQKSDAYLTNNFQALTSNNVGKTITDLSSAKFEEYI